MSRKYQPLTLTPINFSLTEGTSIPAPPDSPPDTPRPPTPGKGPLSSHPTPKSATFPPSATSPLPKDSTDSAAFSHLDKTSTNDGASSTFSPTSPSNSKRPSSVRKFLGSPNTVDSKPNLSRKKSGSWFGKRKSTMIIGPVPEGKENAQPQANGKATSEKKGPPAPALPDLKTFGVSDDTASLGADDLFKNIK